MDSEIQTSTDEKQTWLPPFWVKAMITGFAVGTGGLFLLTLTERRDVLLGIPMSAIMAVSFLALAFLLPVAIAFWLFPGSAFSVFWYWLMRFSREQICVLSLVGILYLLAIHTPFFSLRGVASYFAFLAVFVTGWQLQPAGLQTVPHPTLSPLFQIVRTISRRVDGLPKWALRAVVAVLPVAVISGVIYLVFKSSFANYGPFSFWNDEIGYWVWLRSFVFAGFESGYYAPNELLPAFDFSRYGEASPFYLYIYGGLSLLTGWFSAFPVAVNIAVLTFSILFYFRITQPDNQQVMYTGLALLLSWPVLLYLPITTHETLNQAIGVALTAIVIKLLSSRDEVKPGARLFIVLFVCISTLVRLSWGLMLVPIFFYCLNGRLWQRFVFSILLGGALYGAAVLLMGYLLPPVNNSILGTFSEGFASGPRILWERIEEQFRLMFKFRELNPNMAVTLQMLVVLGWSLSRVWGMIRARSGVETIVHNENVFHLYNVTSLLFAGFVFYLQEGMYRTFAPAMLMVFLLQVRYRDYKRLLALLVVNVLFFSYYMTYYAKVGDYRIVQADYTESLPWDAQSAVEIERFIVFDPESVNPWCNTLLIPLDFYDSRLMLVPPGIGISYILDPDSYSLPIQSKYVLFDPGTYARYQEVVNLDLLASLPAGDLYLNRGSGCPAVR